MLRAASSAASLSAAASFLALLALTGAFFDAGVGLSAFLALAFGLACALAADDGGSGAGPASRAPSDLASSLRSALKSLSLLLVSFVVLSLSGDWNPVIQSGIAGGCCCGLAGVSTLLAARTSKGTSLLLDDMTGHLRLLSRLPTGSPVVRW